MESDKSTISLRDKKNVIPRKFNKIRGRMLIRTNLSEPGDLMDVVKNDYDGYRGLNLRTGEYCACFVSMLRIGEVFEVLEIV